MFVFNRPGMYMLVGGVAVLTLSLFVGLGLGINLVPFAPVGLTWLIWDLVYRWRRGRRFFHPEGGGTLQMFPVWVLGVVVLVAGIAFQRDVSRRDAERAAESRQADDRMRQLLERSNAAAAAATGEAATTGPASRPTIGP